VWAGMQDERVRVKVHATVMNTRYRHPQRPGAVGAQGRPAPYVREAFDARPLLQAHGALSLAPQVCLLEHHIILAQAKQAAGQHECPPGYG